MDGWNLSFSIMIESDGWGELEREEDIGRQLLVVRSDSVYCYMLSTFLKPAPSDLLVWCLLLSNDTDSEYLDTFSCSGNQWMNIDNTQQTYRHVLNKLYIGTVNK
jgi:hypothetical protein